MYCRFLKITVILIIVILFGACGGTNTARLGIELDQSVPAVQPESETQPFSPKSWQDEVAPIHDSTRGVSVFLLDDGGFPAEPANSPLTVKEQNLSNGDLELSVIDCLGNPRPVFFRVRFKDSGMRPADLHRGDWGLQQAIVDTLTTPRGDLDVGIVMIDEESCASSSCLDRTVFRLVLSSDSQRTASYSPRDLTGDTSETSRWEFNHLPYVNTEGVGYVAQWVDHNNHVEACAPDRPWNRDKLDIAWDFARNHTSNSATLMDELMPPMTVMYFDPILQEVVECEVGRTLQFFQVLHGDYNIDGEVNVSDITPVGQLCSVVADRSDYNAFNAAQNGLPVDSGPEPDVLSYTPFRPLDYGATKTGTGFDEIYNKVDGSRDGRIYHPFETSNHDQEVRDWIDDPPVSSDAQYDSDLFAIAAHFYEHLSNYRIEIWKKNGNDEDHDPSSSEYDDELRSSSLAYPSGYQYYLETTVDTWPFLVQEEITYNDLLLPGESSADFWIKIVPVDIRETGDSDDIAVTIIPEAFTATYTNINPSAPIDTTPPTWADSGAGLVTAAPSGELFRGVYAEWKQGIETDSGSKLKGYRVYYRLDPSGSADWTARDVVDYVRNNTDYSMTTCKSYSLTSYGFVREVADPGITKLTTCGYEVDGRGLNTPKLANPVGNWIPGRRVAVVVTAVTNNESQNKLREHGQGATDPKPPDTEASIWDAELDALEVGYTFISYDSTGPVWQEFKVDGDEDKTDVLDTSFSISPDGDEGYNVYWGFAQDLDTGVKDYKAYYSFDVDDVELNATTLRYEFKESSLADIETAEQTVSVTALTDIIDDENASVSEKTFSRLQLTKRFMFLDIPSGYGRTATGYVVVRAINGEGAESDNLVATVLKLTDDASIFDRIVLENDISNPSGPSPEFTSGEMAWRGEMDGETDGLAVAYGADASTFSANDEADSFAPNIGAYYYPVGSNAHPLKYDSWSLILDPGQYSLEEADRLNSAVKDVTKFVEPECEMAVSFDSPTANPRIAFHAQGTFDEQASPPQGLHTYTFLASPTTANTVSADNFNEYPYMLATEDTHKRYPLDLSSDLMCLSGEWVEESSLYANDVIHTPTCMDVGLATPFYAPGYTHDAWQIRDYGTSLQGSLIESVTLEPWTSSMAWTIFGPSRYEDITVLQSSDLRISPLEILWHKFTPDVREDNGSSPEYSNRSKPSREGSDFSWETPDRGLHGTITASGQIGVPATLSVHEFSSSNWGYVLYNSATSAGYPGLGFARAEEPTTSASIDRFTGGISGFPNLQYEISGGGNYSTHYDVLDSVLGGSAFNFRGNRVTIFSALSGVFYATEQLETNAENLDDVMTESPLNFAFIQYDATKNKHIELYYGEIHNIHGESADDAVCIIELVDSLDISDPDNQGTEEFRLLWCSLGMATVDIGAESRMVPVIAYVVERDGTTELKIASLKEDFYQTPNMVGEGDDAKSFYDFYWKYSALPNGGFVYSGQEGDVTTPVDYNGVQLVQ